MTAPERMPPRIWVENHGCGQMHDGQGEVYVRKPPTDGKRLDCAEYIRADIVGKSHNSLSAALELPEVRALVEAARILHADMIHRGEKDRDGVVTVNAGRTAWFDFSAALRAIEGAKP